MTIPLAASSGHATHKPYTKPIPATYARYQPTHEGLFRVVLGKSAQGSDADGDAYDSCLVAEKVGSDTKNGYALELAGLTRCQHGLTNQSGAPAQHGPDDADQPLARARQGLLVGPIRPRRAGSF